MANHFGKLLREKRKKAGYSLAGLAGVLGLTPTSISAIERGVEGPLNAKQITRAARLIEADADELLAAAEKDMRAAFRQQWGF